MSALKLLTGIGLEETTARSALENPTLLSALIAIIQEAGVDSGCDKHIGKLLYTVAARYINGDRPQHLSTVLSYIASGKMRSHQLEAALEYITAARRKSINLTKFEKACGIVPVEDVKAAVDTVINRNKEKLLAERYAAFKMSSLVAQVRELQPHADHRDVKAALDGQLYELLGEKTGDAHKSRKANKARVPEQLPEEDLDPFSSFPSPLDNTGPHVDVELSDGTVFRPSNSREKLEKHLSATGGAVVTRFPPEPNGYSHLGHGKAMGMNFGFACGANGKCYLRLDDTNPEGESDEFTANIQDMVQWLGWKPFKVTYCSDYFEELYEKAVELIKRGYAYVDHQTPAEVKEYREKLLESPWRNRPIDESLELFEKMRAGAVPEGQATLRMKQDMKSNNGNMLDLVAYRIKFASHPRTKDKWCIYPTYDYSHCIVDSLENITHSLCTLEFETRRVSYYWLLDKLDMYLPYVWEYGRLNVSNNLLSKRKLKYLVDKQMVDGWDDPRLLTLAGLRRRGVPPNAINNFCRALGRTRSDNLISTDLVDHFVREELNKTAPRTMVVFQPLKVTIINFEGHEQDQVVEAKRFPDANSPTYKIPFTKTIYIERTDFREHDSKDYYGLSKGKSVLLRYAFPITCVDYICVDGEVVELLATYDPLKAIKPKGVIHWVPEAAPGTKELTVEVRLFGKLFKSEDPRLHSNWLEDFNPQSKEVINDAVALHCLKDVKCGDCFQFERKGYFVVDRDSSSRKTVFNRIVALKSSFRG
ncbi:glutamine--tRNA ligase [Selaginella moellendorffii]|uniref:glutamine--tRNA ligase n=1 Tax=Selaginella moellendorffii TaxID=88036 RepID=UPI000D1D097C|nr:glutamine--tRNA ligase [Selaginella moellendorffii]|eukprot:XP_024516217.1 glutamine--tRNA ligase [Selaginella moellendorffii]